MMKKLSPTSFVAGVILGVLLAGAWALRGEIAFEPAPPSAASSTAPLSTGNGALAVASQPAGNVVVVSSVTVPPPGVWVAVRETEDRELGNVLGAARVAGPKSSVLIPLLRATEPKRLYAVQLYRDDNGGVFTPAVNSAYVDFDTGERVVVYFSTIE